MKLLSLAVPPMVAAVGTIGAVVVAEVATVTSPWTPAMVTALLIGLAAVITAMFTGLATLYGIRREAKHNTRVTEETAAKADRIIEKAVEIHTVTNGNLHKVSESLAVALQQIESLERLVASLVEAKTIADAAAQTAAAKGRA